MEYRIPHSRECDPKITAKEGSSRLTMNTERNTTQRQDHTNPGIYRYISSRTRDSRHISGVCTPINGGDDEGMDVWRRNEGNYRD